MLRLSLFGSVLVTFSRREVRVKSLKARAALAYIALSEGRQETRERLVGLLWSESSEDKARASLRQTLRELRQAFQEVGYDGLRTEWRDVELNSSGVEVDVWSVIEQAENHTAHPSLLHVPGLIDSLLIGLDDIDPAFRVWLLAKRRTLQDRLLRALEAGMRNHALDTLRRNVLAEAIISLDATHEEACRRIMQAKAAAGDTAQALRAYKTLWDVLDDEYGMEPTAETQKLVADIKTGVFEPPAVASGYDSSGFGSSGASVAALGEPGPANIIPPNVQATIVASSSPVVTQPVPATLKETRLALSVQPVAVLAVDPDKVHLVEGFRQYLIASLIRFREWLVTDAPFQLETGGPLHDISGRYEMQMFGQQNGNAVHMTFMLKETGTGLYIWSDGFELKLENWFESQRRIVRRIAMALNVHLSAERLRRVSEQPDVSLSIYDRWLRGQTQVRGFNPEHWDRVKREFTEIIAAAPSFVPAYCGLADMHSIQHIAHPGVFRTRERERLSMDYARKAVQLDPANMRAHLCLSWAYIMAKQYTPAEMHMEVAYELNPHDSWTVISVALLLAFCGQAARAAELAKQSLDFALAPSRTHWAYQVDIEFLGGNYQAAIEAADRAQDVLWGLPAWRTAALAHLGHIHEAAAEGQRFVARIRANWLGDQPVTEAAIVQWLLHLYPISRREDWERLRDGLLMAGLPTDGVDHHGW